MWWWNFLIEKLKVLSSGLFLMILSRWYSLDVMVTLAVWSFSALAFLTLNHTIVDCSHASQEGGERRGDGSCISVQDARGAKVPGHEWQGAFTSSSSPSHVSIMGSSSSPLHVSIEASRWVNEKMRPLRPWTSIEHWLIQSIELPFSKTSRAMGGGEPMVPWSSPWSSARTSPMLSRLRSPPPRITLPGHAYYI